MFTISGRRWSLLLPYNDCHCRCCKSAILHGPRLHDLIYVKEVPEEAAHPKAVRNVKDILGLITKYEILEGEQILIDRLYSDEEKIGLVAAVPRDMRAVAVPVDEVVGVAGFVKPGDRVDIIVTASGVGETGDVAFTVLEDIQVLAVAQETEDKTQGKAKVSTSVTLAVSPSDAEKLVLAERIGKLRLALRPLFATATKGQGIAEYDILRELKWSPPRSVQVPLRSAFSFEYSPGSSFRTRSPPLSKGSTSSGRAERIQPPV